MINGALIRADELWLAHRPAQLGLWDSEASGEPSASLQSASLTKGGRTAAGHVTKLARRSVGEWGRSVVLDDGSATTISNRQALLGIDGWTTDLSVGDRVAVPRRIEWAGQPVDSALAELLAWQIAEGHERPDNAHATITQKDRAVLERLQLIALGLGIHRGIQMNGIPISTPPGRPSHLTINSVAYREWLERLGYEWGHLSATKRIPDFIVSADLATLSLFLRAFFAAEGSVNRTAGNVEITSASREVMEQLSLMLRRFGIWLRIKPKVKAASNSAHPVSRLYWTGYIGGPSLRIFADHIGFDHVPKTEVLTVLMRRTCNTNVEGIPTRDIIDAARATGLPYRYIVPSRGYLTSPGASRAVARGISRRLQAESTMTIERYRSALGRHARPATEGVYERMNPVFVASLAQRLADRVERDVFYARIVSLNATWIRGWTYDLVSRHRKGYVCGGLLVSHESR